MDGSPRDREFLKAGEVFTGDFNRCLYSIKMKRKLIPLTTPGEILKEEFIDPLNLQDKEVAKALAITHSRLSEIIHGKRSITIDTAIRLSRFFRTSPEFWLNYQNNYNLQKEQQI